MADAPSNWDHRRGSGSSGWSNASSSPASINQRPRMPQDAYSNIPVTARTGIVHRNPFQNPSPSPSLYGDSPLQPPVLPFNRPSSVASSSSKDPSIGINLSISYLPSKFSRPVSPGISYRKANKGGTNAIIKPGGGTSAFATGASRMPGEGDDDYDGVDPGAKGIGRLHWNRFKWILFATNSILTIYSLGSLISALFVWFDVFSKASIVLVGNHGELTASTVASCICMFTALIGWAGILLNNRSFLAIYTLALWVSFVLLVVPGYITYKKCTFNLEGKINSQWSRSLGVNNRLIIQNNLNCCGYFNPFVEATLSASCYSRSMLPGCKGSYLDYERDILIKWYTIVFSLVPFHLACMIAALLCSNHVTYRFGKGMMPKAYRLNAESMAAIMDSYANQLAEHYNGEDMSKNQRASNFALIENYANGYQSRNSSASSYDVSPGGGMSNYGSYGSASGLLRTPEDRNREYPPGNADGNSNLRDRTQDKRI